MKPGKELNGQSLFHEVQTFNAPPTNRIVLGSLMLLAGVGLISVMAHLRTPGQEKVAWNAGAAILGGAAVAWFLFRHCRMETEVRTGGLFIRFRPFIWNWKRIETDGMVRHRAVTYSPIWDYGGWGIRIGWQRRAYNPSGTRGVRIEYADGRHVLVGSAKPEELDAALETMRWRPINLPEPEPERNS